MLIGGGIDYQEEERQKVTFWGDAILPPFILTWGHA